MMKPWVLVLGTAALALAMMLPAQAGTFHVSPVRILLNGEKPSATLRLENQGEEPVLIQAELMAWSQETGQDVLVPTEDFVVSPPIFRVAAQGAQSIRVRLLRPADPAGEMTYRLFLQEVPSNTPGQQAIGVALRLGLPIFVTPAAPVAPALQWKASLGDDGKLRLTLSNLGGAHMQLTQLRLVAEDNKVLDEQNLNLYVLRNSARTISFSGGKDLRGRKLRLEGKTDVGDLRTELIIE